MAASASVALSRRKRCMPLSWFPLPQQFQHPQRQPQELKQIGTEQIQAMLDENSSLIVEIIELNTQIKHGKGTAQLGEFTEKLDKKRKNLNKNLMTLAKWADESSETSPRQPQALRQSQMTQQQHQHYARSEMMQMPMSNQAQLQAQAQAQAQARAQAQAQVQARLQAQAQAQAYAQAQYQARINPLISQQYAQMNSMTQQQQPQQQQRFANGGMPFGVPESVPHPVRLNNAIPSNYTDSRSAMASNMSFQMGPQSYSMMPQTQMQRLSSGTQEMSQQDMLQQALQQQSLSHQSMAMVQQSMGMPQPSMATPQQSIQQNMAALQQSMSLSQQGVPHQNVQMPQQGMASIQMNGPMNSGSMADASGQMNN